MCGGGAPRGICRAFSPVELNSISFSWWRSTGFEGKLFLWLIFSYTHLYSIATRSPPFFKKSCCLLELIFAVKVHGLQVCVCVDVSVYVCVRARVRERESSRARARFMCVCYVRLCLYGIALYTHTHVLSVSMIYHYSTRVEK